MECVCVLLSMGRGHLSETGGKGWPQEMARGQGRTESDPRGGRRGLQGRPEGGSVHRALELSCGPWTVPHWGELGHPERSGVS